MFNTTNMVNLIDNNIDKNNCRITFINLVSISFCFHFSILVSFYWQLILKGNCKNCFSNFPILFSVFPCRLLGFHGYHKIYKKGTPFSRVMWIFVSVKWEKAKYSWVIFLYMLNSWELFRVCDSKWVCSIRILVSLESRFRFLIVLVRFGSSGEEPWTS